MKIYMKKRVLLSIAATIAMVGCAKHEIEAPVPTLDFEPEDIVATFDEDTKTYLAENNSSVYWSESDKITILYKATSFAMQYMLKSGEAGKDNGTFGYDSYYWDTTCNPFEKYYGIYPAYENNAASIMENGILQVNIPSEQVYTQKSYDKSAAVMTASSSNTNFSFKNATGLLKIFLTPTQAGIPPIFSVKKVVLRSENHLLAGSAYIDNSDAAVIKEGGVQSVTLESETGIALNESETFKTYRGNAFIFALPPTIFEDKDLTITIYINRPDGTSSHMTKSLPTGENGFKVERSKISTIPVGYTADDFDGGIFTVVKDIAGLNEKLEEGATAIELEGANDADQTNVIFPKAAEGQDISIEISGEVKEQPEGKEYAGEKVIYFTNEEHADGNDGPAELNITAPAGTILIFDTPQSHVTVNGTEYERISGRFDVNTLVIPKGVTVGTLIMKKGSASILGTVEALDVVEEGTDKVYFKECRNIPNAMYAAKMATRVHEDYKSVDNGDGTWDIIEKPSVARIGNKEYKSFQDALDALQPGETVTVLMDIEDSEVLRMNKAADGEYTIDFDNHKVTFASTTEKDEMAFEIEGKGTYHFMNGTLECADYHYGDVLETYCITYLTNMTINFEDESVSGYARWGAIYSGAESMYIDNCTINAIKGPGIQNGEKNSQMYISNSTIVSGDHDALYCGGGSVTYVENSTAEGVRAIHGCTSGAAFVIKSGTFTGTTASVQVDNTKNAIDYLGVPNYAGGSVAIIESGNFTGPIVRKVAAGGQAEIQISGGTFSVDPSVYVISGYKAEDNGNGTWTVIENSAVARIGGTDYDSLTDAAAAATSGQTITLLADIADAGSIELKAGVTLDGDGNKISGDSSIWINAAGGTIQNVVFENIHNNSTPSADDISKYNLPTDKVGTLTAVYARALTGELHITGCTFDSVDWDAIQITPQNGSTIYIANNTFTHTNTVTNQIRYVHIESSVTKSPYVSAEITVTDNKFYDTEAVGVGAICNIGAYYINYTTGDPVNYSGNWFETINNCDIKNGVSDNGYYIYPARSQADVDVDDNCPAARRVETPIDYYETLQKAFDSGENLILMKNTDEDVAVPESYKKQLQLREFRIKSIITNNGILDITATPSDEEFTGRVINNGTLKTSNQYRLIGLQIVNNGRFEIAVADGFVGDLSTITNNTDGLIVISKGTYQTSQLAAMGGTIEITGGTFDAKPNDEWIPWGYLATDKGNGTFTVAKMTDAQAVEHGAIARTGSSTSASRVYYTTIPESVSGEIYLLTTVNGEYNRTTTTTLNLNGYGFTGSLDDAGYNLTLKTKSKTETTAIFNALKCQSLTVGYKTTSASSAQPVIATVKNGTITGALTVNVSATLNVEGGTFNEAITVFEHAVNSKTGVETITGGTLNISGGQFFGTITVGTGATLTITGGTFSFDPSDYVATGYEAVNNGDGTWTVSEQ